MNIQGIIGRYSGNIAKKATTGIPPLTRFSLLQIPLPWFLAYERASGGIFWEILGK